MSFLQPARFTIAATLLAVGATAGCGSAGRFPGRDAGPGDAGTGGAASGTGGAGGTGSTGSTGSAGDAGVDAPDFCGRCAPGSASGWDDATIVWIGAEKDAPKCPADAPALVFEGNAGLDAPLDCGTCTCATPSGTCGLPATLTANAATCALNLASTPHTPFNPASGWNGSCDTNASIPSGKLCSGAKCVQSLTLGPLLESESGCAPSPAPTQAKPSWKTYARACEAVPLMTCDPGTGIGSGVCLAFPPPSAGFRVCMYHGGDNDCPSFSPYSEKHLFYDAYQDTRACGACTCGTAGGSTCSATVSIYTDGACSTLAYSAGVDAAGPSCHDLPPGSPLGSKAAGVATYAPGACPPGGGMPMGGAIPIMASTMCCLPP